MNLSLKSTIDYGLDEISDLLTRGFEDYFVPIQFTKEAFAVMLRLDGVDLNNSSIILKDEKPVGCALWAHRGWTSRLAAMGLVKDARGGGIGRWAMDELIDDSRNRGDRELVLEVIEQNERGVRLYKSCGFEIQRRLLGFANENPNGIHHGDLEELDIRQVARILSDYGPADLPWQSSAATLAQMGPPNMAVKLGNAYSVISDPEQSVVAIRSLVVKPENRRDGAATNLMQTLFAQFPNKTWKVPILMPEETAPGLLESLGFVREELSQYQMSLNL